MKKKLLYFILSVVFILSGTIVYANTTSEQADIQILPTAGGNLTGEYKLTSDTTITSTITVPAGQSFKLDLNGYVLKHSAGERPLIINEGANVTIKDSNPTNSHYGTITNDLWVYNSSATSGVEIKGGIITGGVKSDRGGAIFNNGILTMEGGTIAGCKAIANSNANENDVDKYLVNTFTNGTGGAIFINDTATFIMNGGSIKYCKAEVNSLAKKSGGGAVFVDCNAGNIGTFIMNDGIIQNCRSLNGGAVYVHSNIATGNTLETAGVFTMNAGEISNCHASSTGNDYGGGAIYINSTLKSGSSVASVSSFNMLGGELKNNTSNGMGGAVYTRGKFTMSEGVTLSGNTTKNTGTILNSKDVYTGFGGAVFCMTETANFVMNGGTITNCKSASGGGVMVYTSSTFTMNGGTISNCSSQGDGGTGNGGAVYVQASTFNFNEGTLEGNWARRYGGAININQTANLYLNGACNIIDNTANHGGGISQEAGDCQIKLDNENILIKGNKAQGASNDGNGGGLFVEKGVLDISACTIVENSASNNGGGIALRVARIGGDVTVNMTGGTISKNTAKVNGGGIDIFADYTFVQNDESNDANKQNDVVVNLKSGVLGNNNADGNGAGINIFVNEKNSTALMNIGDEKNSTGPEIINNTSLMQGGGICINGGSIKMVAGNIDNCSANEGGGVYILGGDMEIKGGQINGGKATSGGGIYISNGDITMNGGRLSNNQATLYGGGIFASSDTQDLNITITSGEIIGNIANAHGGGVGVDMGAGLSAKVTIGLQSCNGLDETHSHPVIKDNTANEKGGGFCLHGDSLEMTMYCGSISTNIAIREPGSANINQTGGLVTVHGGTVNGGITIIGGDYVYIPGESTKVGVTYNSNIPGSTQIEQAEITPGVIISLPKNLFIRDGYVLVGWSTVATPGQSDTVYPAGGLYTIPNESIVLYSIWLIDGAGSIETPAINSGKIYDEFTGDVNVMISCDSAFTTVMSVLDMQPNLYENRTLSFSNNLKAGTTIMMIDLTQENARKYYYYKVESDETNTITLSSFKKMGSQDNFIDSTVENKVDEKFIFVIDLADSNTTTNSTEMKLTRYSADEEIAKIEQNVSFTTTAQRTFNFTWTNESDNLVLGDKFDLSYEASNTNVGESRYDGKKITLVIEGANGEEIPNEAKLSDGTNYYNINPNGQFVIPLGDITESKSISLSLESKSLLVVEQSCTLKAELWVSANEDSEKPFMGEKVATIDNILLNAMPLPALKVEMKDRIYRINDFNGNIKLNYETKNIENCEVTLEVQKKNGGVYETKENILTEVSNSTSSQNGVFSLDVGESGKLNVSLENSNLGVGTYRVLIKVIKDTEVVYTIPYNFIILE